MDFRERIATRIGHNRTVERLHFLSLAELESALKRAGFTSWEVRREAGPTLELDAGGAGVEASGVNSTS